MKSVMALLVLVFIVVLTPLFVTLQANEMNLPQAFMGPSAEHFFGLDENGSDIFAKVFLGARVSLLVAFCVVTVNLFVGLLVGSLSGYVGAATDNIIMRALDVVQAFPNFLLALSVLAVLGASVGNLILALCLTGWVRFARMARGEILYLKNQSYVESARALGAKPLRIVLLHLWPNLIGPMSVQAAFAFSGAILAESGLSFLGLGIPSHIPSWGALLSSGRYYLFEAPQMTIFPGLFLLLFVVLFNNIGEELQRRFRPQT